MALRGITKARLSLIRFSGILARLVFHANSAGQPGNLIRAFMRGCTLTTLTFALGFDSDLSSLENDLGNSPSPCGNSLLWGSLF